MAPLRQFLLRLIAGLALGGILLIFARTLGRETWPRADLVLGNGPEPRSLDPAGVSSKSEGRLLSFLFEGLVVPDPKTLEPRPAMAERWEAHDRGRAWHFHLRPGLVWSDGVPIVAADLRWSYLRLLDPSTGADYASLLWCLQGAEAFTRSPKNERSARREAVGIEAPDDRSLIFRLGSVTPWVPSLTAFFPLYPVPRHIVETDGEAFTRRVPFVGNGPFRLVARRLRDRIRLEKNPRYWARSEVGLRSVDVVVSDSLTTLLNLYMAGRIDWVYDVPSAAVPALLEKHGDAFRPFPYLGTYFYRVNTQKPPFDNLHLRRALSLSLDRDAIVTQVCGCREPAARSFVPQLLPGYSPPKIEMGNTTRAREELALGLQELHLDRLPTFELLYNNGEMHRRIAEFIQHRWRETLGVECRLVNMEWGAYKQALRSGRYDVARSSWLGDYLDPTTFLDVFRAESSNNQTGWRDPAYDALLDRAAREDQVSSRARLLAKAEERLLRSCAVIPLFHDVTRILVRPDIEGFFPNLMDEHPPRFLRRKR